MLILFLIVFIDIVAFGMIIPLLPYLKFIYGIGSQETGYLVSLFALSALVGSIFWGMLSDKIGRKFTLVFPLLVSAVIYFGSAFAFTFMQLLVLRILAGFFTSNFPVAFAAAADKTEKLKRYKAMAILGMAFSTGFMLGPTLGGYFAQGRGIFASLLNTDKGIYTLPSGDIINLQSPFFVAAILSLVSGFLGMLLFKETLTKKDIAGLVKVNLLQQMKNIYTNKVILFFSFLTVVFGAIFSAIEIAISLFLYDRFQFAVNYVGFYWAFFAIFVAISRLISISLAKRAKTALMVGFLSLSIGLLLLIIANTLVVLALSTFIMAFGIGLVLTIIGGSLSLQGQKNQQGTIFGINQLFSNIGRVIGPSVITIVYAFNINLSWLLLTFLSIISIIMIKFFLKSDTSVKELKSATAV